MQNTMNQFNTLADQLRQDAKNFENQICDLIDAERKKGKSLFRKSQECKDLTQELTNFYADAENKLNTVYQGKIFYESDMQDLLQYYALKAICTNDLKGQRTFKRNLDKFEKTLLEYIKSDPNFETDENFRLSIYSCGWPEGISIYLHVNKYLRLTVKISVTYMYTNNEPDWKKTYFADYLSVPKEKPEISAADEYITLADTIKKTRKEYFEKLNEFREANNHLLNTYGKYCEFSKEESGTFKIKR